MILSRRYGRRAIEGFCPLSLMCGIMLVVFCRAPEMSAQSVDQHQKLLSEIHEEVVQLGVGDDPDLIKKEFWMELDGKEDNKEEHVVVMRYNDGMNLKMTVQVTYFSEDKGKRLVRFAVDTKLVQCCFKGHELEITRSDYGDEEMGKLLGDILVGIRHKKELLKLIKQ